MRARRIVVRLLLAAALLGGLVVVMVVIQRALLFPSYAVRAKPGAGRGVEGLERIWLDTDEGRVEAWYLPGEGASAERPGPAVIFAHGNAELIEQWPEALRRYRELGFGLLLPEYRGYGRSAGRPSQSAITEDFVRFHDALAERPEVDRERIVFHGRSLGGGAVCALARRRRPAALVLQSTFTSVPDVAKRWFVPRFLVVDPFDNLETVRALDAPVLVVHGRRDGLIPASHASALEGAARDGRLVLYEADHNDCPPDWDRFFRDVEAFLAHADLLPAR